MDKDYEQHAGVYAILHMSTGKTYIGSTGRCIKIRRQEHVRLLSKGTHDNPRLQNAWNKYGQDAFEFKIILLCDPDNSLMYEQIVIDSFKPFYNMCPVAESRLGAKMSEASRDKMSEAKSGTRHPLYGKGHTDEARAKMRTAKKGEKHGRAKLTDDEVYQIKLRLLDGELMTVIAREHNVNRSTISYIRSGKTWSHIRLSEDST
jgi:group I intron endonuclease